MKIHYNLSGKYIKYCNEACGIGLLKKKLKKNPNKKIKSYIFCVTSRFILSFILWYILSVIFFMYTSDDSQELLDFIWLLGASIMAFYLISVGVFFERIFNKKTSCKEGILEISKNGIVDKLKNGFLIGFSYEKLELIVITSDVISFLFDHPIMIFIKNENLDKVKMINKIKQFSDVQIIDRTK